MRRRRVLRICRGWKWRARSSAATIDEKHNPFGLKVGDRVCALLAGGGYAEYAAAPLVQCLPVPEGLVGRRGGVAAGNILHGVEQRVRPRATRQGRGRPERDAAGAGRLERHRRDGDPDRARAGSSRVRHGRLGRKVPRLRGARRRTCDQLQDRRFRRGHQVADERSRRRRDPRHGGGRVMCRAS